MALETENKISTLKKTRRKQHEDEEKKLLAYAYRADGTFVNQELLAMGLAEMKEEKENTMYAEDLRLAQEAAKGKGLGRWAKE